MAEHIPFEKAKQLAHEFDLDQVILVAWGRKDGRTHVVTYGRSLQDSTQAAAGGDRVQAALGWPEHLRAPVPARVQGMVDALESAADRLDSLIAALSMTKLSPAIHVEALRSALPDVAAELRAAIAKSEGRDA